MNWRPTVRRMPEQVPYRDVIAIRIKIISCTNAGDMSFSYLSAIQ